MNRDDIIKWAQEAQLPYYFPTSGELAYSNELLRFAELVADAEREKRKPEPPGIARVKDLFIVDGGDHLWIGETNGGEGGAFSKDKFYEVLDKFYRENF